MQTRSTDFWKLFKPKSCAIKMKAGAKPELLEELIANLITAGVLDKELQGPALKALQDREVLASTGVGAGVAIPHVALAGLESAVVSLSVHTEGLAWDALDGEPVQILFTVLRPKSPNADHDPQRHLEMMQWVARLARDADFRRFALAAKTKTELANLLKELAGA